MATVSYIPLAPFMGLFMGFFIMVAVFWLFRHLRPTVVDNVFRRGQLISAALYSLGHGGNDAQKTMGMIVALLIAAGIFDHNIELSLTDWHTLWIILSCHAAMAIGTALGGWRIVKTMGMKITKLRPVGGFCAETSGAVTLAMATFMGVPVSTTHTITGSIVGVGTAERRLNAVRWGVAGRIVWAWIFTIPASATIAVLCYFAIKAIAGNP